MSTQRIIYQTPDGGVAVVVPAPNSGLSIQELAAKDVPAGVPADIVEVSEIPSDRTFRNAWEKSGRAVVTNLGKAKGIAHDKRRAARAKEFAPLDVEATIPSRAQQAEAARQAVRDKYAVMQEQMDAAESVEQLKSLLPED